MTSLWLLCVSMCMHIGVVIAGSPKGSIFIKKHLLACSPGELLLWALWAHRPIELSCEGPDPALTGGSLCLDYRGLFFQVPLKDGEMLLNKGRCKNCMLFLGLSEVIWEELHLSSPADNINLSHRLQKLNFLAREMSLPSHPAVFSVSLGNHTPAPKSCLHLLACSQCCELPPPLLLPHMSRTGALRETWETPFTQKQTRELPAT